MADPTKIAEAPAMPKNLALVVLHALAQLARAAGKTKQANALTTLANLIEAGKNVDAHMATLVARLQQDDYDWNGATDRIIQNSEW